jgi:hypothetical protein
MLHNGDVLDNKAYRSASYLDSRLATVELADLVTGGLVTLTGGRRWARHVMNWHRNFPRPRPTNGPWLCGRTGEGRSWAHWVTRS